MMMREFAGPVVMAGTILMWVTGAPLATGRPLRSRPIMAVATANTFTWHGGDGSYRFGMRGDDQWRVETRDRYGSVLGQYHYRTPDGGKSQVKFKAGPKMKDFESNQRALVALTGRVGGGGELLFDTARPDASGLPSYSDIPAPLSQTQEQAFDQGIDAEGPLKLAGNDVYKEQFDQIQTKESSKAVLASLWQQEGVMPYGALLMVSSGDAPPLLPGTEDPELNAIVTNVQSFV